MSSTRQANHHCVHHVGNSAGDTPNQVFERHRFRTKGQLAIDICADAYADSIGFDFACGDEVYGNCTQLREFFEDNDQAYVLRVPSNFTLSLAAGTKLTCAEAAKALLERQAALGGPLRRPRLQGRTLVRLDLACHRIGAPSTRRHRARSRWFHKRARLARDADIALVS